MLLLKISIRHQRVNEAINDIGREIVRDLQPGPQSDWRRLSNISREANGVQIIVQEHPPSAMQCITAQSDPGPAFFPGAYSAQIITGCRKQEDVRAMPGTLSLSLQPATVDGQAFQVETVINGYEKIGILRVCFRGAERSYQRDLAHTVNAANMLYE